MRNIGDIMRSWVLSSFIIGALTMAGGASYAQTPDYGKLRAAIRGADYSCAHVQKVSDAGNEAWNVQCNSGLFLVTRVADDKFSVIKKAPSE